MTKQKLEVVVQVPDCSVCGKALVVGSVYYKRRTQVTKEKTVFVIGARGEILKALPDEERVYCEECVPADILHPLEGR